MPFDLKRDLDALADWRAALDRRIAPLAALLAEHDLQDAAGTALVAALHQRLASDRLVLAFVAEYSRGKSELINALFFAGTGRRVMPATPGRTTMCPVELAWEPSQPAELALLPIATRHGGATVAALRQQPEAWQRHALPLDDADALAGVLEAVTRTLKVPLDEARALGFWDDEQPDDNPPRDADDQVEVPAWRHALINFPHPLLAHGLSVIDTPGLNAIGAEPELTLGLLPSAHATLFVLAADTGVTRSDLAIWRDHLGDRAIERFVVLNKVDTLADPLLTPDQVARQVRSQCEQVAQTLGVPANRVFALSARQALAARIRGDDAGLAGSGLVALEQALAAELLPRRAAMIGRLVEDAVLALQQCALQRLADRRRQGAEQLVELRGLRGKGSARLQMLASRFERDAADFEQCAPRLAALRAVQNRLLHEALRELASERVRDEVLRMHGDSEASLFKLGAGRAFARLMQRLHGQLDRAERGIDEIDEMLGASHQLLNAQFGFALGTAPKPKLDGYRRELQRIDAGYSRYFGVLRLWRLSEPGFLQQFLRVLLSRLRVVFENAAAEIELWCRTANGQMETQLGDRRRSLQQRREAFTRVQAAEGELERRIVEVEAHDEQLQQLAGRVAAEVDALRILAASPPAALRHAAGEPPLQAEPVPAAVHEPPPVDDTAAPRLSLVHSGPGARAPRGAGQG